MSQFQKDQVQDIYYLSPMQEGMLFHTLLHPEQHFYIEQLSMDVEGSFRTDLLEKSLNVLVDRYDIFRTVFVHEIMKRPVQVVLNRRNVQVSEIDLSGLSGELQEQRIQEYKQQDKEQGFDLSKDIPLRTRVFKKAEGVYEWVWSYHHILLDGWCFGIVIQELFQVYESLAHDSPIDLPPVKPYKEYIHWLEAQDKDESLNYWGRYLSGFEGQTSFAEQRKKRSGNRHESAEMRFQLSEDQTRAFSEMASAQGVTQNTVIQAVWAVLVSRYQRANDLVFGAVVSGRPSDIDGVESMVGLFINVVPKRVKVSPDSSFAELLAEIQRQSLESEPHQYVPIYDIQSRAEQQNLIDHILVFENYPLQEADQGQEKQRLGFSIGNTDVFEKSNYDLNLVASPGRELMLKVAYNANVYDHSFILRLKGQLIEIIRQISQNPHTPLGDIRVVSEEEEQRLLVEFNGTALGESDPLTLPQRFERHVALIPHHTALTSGNQTLSYAELNAQANRFARTLLRHGVVRGTVVALLLHRSSEMIISIMSVLKAGGAYVPIDPTYPEERIRYMLEDSGAALLLTQHELTGCVAEVGYEGTSLFVDDPHHYYGDSANIEIDGDPSDLAYIMYTSGTTGTPKGNLTTHANISRVVRETNYIEITGKDTLLSLSNYAFDGFTFDLFGALLNGAKLAVASQETILNIGRLTKLIVDERITVMFVTTALFNVLVDTGSGWMKGTRKVLFGGERSSVHHVRKALQLMGKDWLIHVYGPTETTVFATFHPVNEVAEEAATIPIGTPLHLTGAYILGPTNQLQPIEAVGELCLSGTGLARGYLNRPELTAEKFVPHPFTPGDKLYRTGDLARWLPDGSIELTGRIDDQVKIRGHRIELAEIEAQLLRHESIKEAVVLAVRSEIGAASLCAYIVAESGVESSEEFASHLTKTLPSYMIPQSYVLLDHLPLNANGKVNRRLLPEAQAAAQTARESTPPRNDVERKLTAIWSELLNVQQIGIHDNFFDLGGHSLKAMALCAIILKQFGKDVPVSRLFETPTVAGLSAFLQNAENDTDEKPAMTGKPEKTIFNPEGSRNLFLFPPVLGFGIMFHELAQLLPEYRFHAFDFMAEEDRIGMYVESILDSQPEGPIYLLGYSAGCGLAFEVAQALEQTGRDVEKLVMVDSYLKTGITDLEGRSVKQDVEALMEANRDNPYLEIESVRQGFQGKLTAYYTYNVNLIHSGQVQAPIHLIQSEQAVSLPSWMSSWSEATSSYYEEHQGYGKHDEMLQGDSAMLNAMLIRWIWQEVGNNLDLISKLQAPVAYTG